MLNLQFGVTQEITMVQTDFCGCGNEYCTWQVVEEYLPDRILKKYKSDFNQFDPDKTGVIPLEDVVKIFANNGKKYTFDEIRNYLQEMTDCVSCYQCTDNYVDFTEYLALTISLQKNCVSEDVILQVFKKFDQDGDGFIGREELKCLLSKLGDEISEKEVEEMIREADRDGDGLVSYQEFVRIITNSSSNHCVKAANANQDINHNCCLEPLDKPHVCSTIKEDQEREKEFIKYSKRHHKRKRHGKRNSIKNSVMVFVRKSFRETKKSIIEK